MHLFSENYENDVVNYNINSDNKLNINNQNNINISNSLVDNNKKIINLLSILGNNKNNIIYLITNKSKDAFKELHLNPINFGFVAEEGFLIKPYGEQNFKTVFRTTNNNWKNTLIKLFSNFSRKIGDGTIIKKEYSISWIYNNNENNNNYMVGEELKFLVENIIDKTKFDINLDKNNLEVTIKNQNKFQYIFDIIQKIVADNKNFNLIFGLNNNDKYGEGFFEYLYNIEKDFKKNKRVINVFTSVIGKKTTKAKYFFKDITDFIDILKVFDIKK
jgi:trehalose-6-phosphatase